MALSPPPLPSRFPCWCRAIYSWGGEVCDMTSRVPLLSIANISAVQTRPGIYRGRLDRMSECGRRFVVGGQAISRSEDCRVFPVQFRRGATRRLSANKNTESYTAEYSVRAQGGAAEITNISETLRGICQGATLYHSKTTRNISRNTDVASQGKAV
ncbi:hypothetical protein V8C43DRAFT_42480 [Trichoderma afarasin]